MLERAKSHCATEAKVPQSPKLGESLKSQKETIELFAHRIQEQTRPQEIGRDIHRRHSQSKNESPSAQEARFRPSQEINRRGRLLAFPRITTSIALPGCRKGLSLS